MSDPVHGSRHIQILLDENDELIAASDFVMLFRDTNERHDPTLTDHQSFGGRFEKDGSFRGTHLGMTLANAGDPECSTVRTAQYRPPTEIEIAALRRLTDDVLNRLRR